MAVSNRFRVTKSGDTVNLFGVISDTTNFHVIDEMLDGTEIMDCSNLLSASWNGVINFDKYLRNLSNRVRLTKIPNHIFNYLRLMPEVNAKYSLDKVEVNVVDLKDKDLAISPLLLSTQEIQDLAQESSRAFLQVNGSREIIGRDNFVCPEQFGKSSIASNRDGAGDWYTENLDEYNFWFDYCNFSNTTGCLALDLVESLQTTLQAIFSEIDLGLKSAADATRILYHQALQEDPCNMKKIADHMAAECNKLVSAMTDVNSEQQKILLNMQLISHQETFKSQDPLYSLGYEFSHSMLKLEEILPIVEEVGAETGKRISQITLIDKIKMAVEDIKEEQVDAEVLSQARDILEIMDPLSEDSWEDTKVEFMSQIDDIYKLIGESVILLQGFDLLRQILEHRFAEAKKIKEYLSAPDDKLWLELQDEVYQLIGKTLVTDQEKYSCEFFLPNAAGQEGDKQSPGDVLLF